jgi:hypothetical protein
MIAALIVYILCGLSGWFVERGFAFNSLLKRIVVVTAIASAQLIVVIQGLSLFRALNGITLMAGTAALTTGVFLATRKWCRDGVGWRELACNRWREFRETPKDLVSAAILVVGVGLFLFSCAAAWALAPSNDSYHFEMPVFWIQHRTIFPFPMYNPRVPALSFLSEASQLPGYLYARSIYPTVIATIFLAALTLWVVFSLARRIGASFVIAASVAAVALGLSAFSGNLQQGSAEMFLAGAFVGASMIFLFDAKQRSDLGWSVFLFAMACGAKNSTTLLGPPYLVVLVIVCRRLFELGWLRKLAPTIVGVGLVGLVCSGVVWNYTSNKIWFGKNGMPRMLKETVSHNFRPREIWTRQLRGLALLLGDTIWLPKSMRGPYVDAVEGGMKILGAEKSVREDRAFFFFEAAAGRGYGIVGVAILVPAFIVAAAKAYRRRCFAIGALVFMATAAFFMVHLILRWQSVGVLRLMFPFAVLAAPLIALVIERKIARVFALLVLAISSGLMSVYSLGMIGRRLDVADRPVFNKIARLQNDRSYIARYSWLGKEPGELRVREDYTMAEIHGLILRGLQQPATLGVIGHGNTESLFLFGKRFQNRIVPLVDCREEGKILDVPTGDLDYVVALDKFDDAKAWAVARDFETLFECSQETNTIALVFKRAR